MKMNFAVITFAFLNVTPFLLKAQSTSAVTNSTNNKNIYIDVHQLTPGKVKFKDVAAAHAKDLAVENKYDVHFIKYWVNEEKGLVYCLSSAKDTAAIKSTHAEAHGLIPVAYYLVTDSKEAALKGNSHFFLDTHYLGAGKVAAKDVEAAHQKDLALQHLHGVNFINYWVDEKNGVIMCLSQAKDSTSVIETHKQAHGLLPATIVEVKQGQ